MASLRPRPRAASQPRLELSPPRCALPHRVRPFPDEVTESYLDRLATANHLDTGDLRRYLAREKRARSAPLDVPALATLTGVPEAALRHAMPELSAPEELAVLGTMLGRPRPGFASQGPACRSCVAVRGGGPMVMRWHTHENVLCRRHRLWTHIRRGGSSGQLDLRDHPEIVAANSLHRRLIRRFGRTAVHTAFEEARLICYEWPRYSPDQRATMNNRINALYGRPTSVYAGDPAIDAAIYAQQVALTRLLASPAWASLILDDYPGDDAYTVGIGDLVLARLDDEIRGRQPSAGSALSQPERELLREAVLLRERPGTRQFVNEVRRTVAPGYIWVPFEANNKCEPLAEWVKERVRARRSRPGPGRRWPPPDEALTPGHLRQQPATS